MRLNSDELWRQYRQEKRTIAQLARAHACSERTIRRHLACAQKNAQFAEHQNVNVILDTTYFGRSWGVMVLLDSLSGQALSVQIVRYETNALYQQALQQLLDKGINLQSIICDGRRGLLDLFPHTPTQMCQFHQIKIVKRYLTNNPKSPAAKDLHQLVLTLTNSTEKQFQAAFNGWFEQHKNYLNERTYNEQTGKSSYTHKRLRSAYLSLKRHLPYLFTFERFPSLEIPNTTNLLESRFASLKDHLRCHRGLNRENKIKFIKDYFSI